MALLPGTPATPRQRIAAVMEAIGPPAVASHETAAYLHGIREEAPEKVTIIVPHSRRAARLDGERTVRSRTLRPSDVTRESGLTVTTPERTVLDLAVGLPPDRITALLLDARQRTSLTWESIATRAGQRIDRRAAARLLRALATLDGDGSDSIFEHAVRAWLRDQGLDPSSAPYPVKTAVGTLKVDIAFPDQRVAIECEGFAYHHDRQALERDQRRANALVAAGWRVLRVSWRRFLDDPEGLLEELRELLAG